jgi:hypothetical protein
MAMLGVLLAAVPAPSLAAASDSPIVIRTYDASGLPEADRGAALAAAITILEDTGLAVARLACEEVDGAALVHPCRSPLGSHELSLRLVRLAPTDTGATHVTLGYSLVDTQVRFGSLATVYVDRVADLGVASRIDLPTLLGRAIAHEVGHLLLGTAAHARAGVMRAVWSPEALRRSLAGDWLFTPRDAQALRAAARRRTAACPEA